MFGKLMSISDELMARYYELLLGTRSAEDMHPLEAKKQLAFEIVQTYHSADAAKRTLDEWNTRFSKRDLKNADLPPFSPDERQDFTPSLSCRMFIGKCSSQKIAQRSLATDQAGKRGTRWNKIRDPKAKSPFTRARSCASTVNVPCALA
jgi:tyrosyl-tRNA synthetase